MTDKTELTLDEQRAVSELADKIIDATTNSKVSRSEIFKQLASFVSGVKLGLIAKPEPVS